MNRLCPCGSKLAYVECCSMLHKEQIKAKDPEQLMRSRYSAFALGLVDYLLVTSSGRLRATLTERDLQDTCHFYSFVRLDVINSTQDTVEFKALLLHDNVIETLHENSKFIIENGRWCYDSGEIKEVAPLKLTRNDKCPCGSGSKFKQCHMK